MFDYILNVSIVLIIKMHVKIKNLISFPCPNLDVTVDTATSTGTVTER